MFIVRAVLFLLFIASASIAVAGFDRFVDENCSDESNCFYWRPKIAPLAGWHIDEASSKLTLANVLVPDGETYDSAKVVIYARAIEKANVQGDVKTVDDYIAFARNDMIENWPGTTATPAPALKTGDRKALKAQTFVPAAGGKNRYERSAYGAEGRFFLVFELNAGSQAELDANMKVFEKFVASYKANAKRR